MEILITHISFDDFQKLNLKGKRHVRKYFRSSDDKEVPYTETIESFYDKNGDLHTLHLNGFYSKLVWDEIDFTEVVKENIEFSKEQDWKNPICLAIHKKGENEIESSYLDKWLTPGGLQTYLIRCDVKHLYSRRNYFYTKDDYFDIDKRQTEKVYLIYF